MIDYVMIKAETTAGTFVTPTITLPVKTWVHDDGIAHMMSRETGGTRGVPSVEKGASKSSGSFEVYATPESLPYLIKAALFNTVTKSTPGGATNARDHVFIMDDTAAMKTLSVQLQHRGNGTNVAINLRGVVINKLTITTKAEDYCLVKGDYFAFEGCLAGGTFANGDSSVALQSPTTPAPIEKFNFGNATLTYAGTVAKDGTTKVYTQSTGTALTKVESVEFTIDQGITQRVFLDSFAVGEMNAGERKIDFSFTLANDTPATTFHAKMTALTQEPLFLLMQTIGVIEGSTPYDLEIGLPQVYYAAAPFGDLSGAAGARSISISGSAVIYATTDDDIAIRMRDDNDTGY